MGPLSMEIKWSMSIEARTGSDITPVHSYDEAYSLGRARTTGLGSGGVSCKGTG